MTKKIRFAESPSSKIVLYSRSKLVEKSVFVQLNNYLTVSSLHERFQSAYKVHHSTETALLTITNDILLSLDRGEQCVPIVTGFVSGI